MPVLPVALEDEAETPPISPISPPLVPPQRHSNRRADQFDLEDLDSTGVFFPSPDEVVVENADFSIRGGFRSLLSFHAILASTSSSSAALCPPAAPRTNAPPVSSFFMSHTFEARRPFFQFNFSRGAVAVLTTPNAGGASENSEALSFEVLHRLFGAHLVKTEMQIHYAPNSKKTDYLILIGDQRLGVSVTRAMKHTDPLDFTPNDAEALLMKKLKGIRVSTAGVDPVDSWERQLLHVWAQDQRISDLLEDTFDALPQEVRGDTILICTVAPNDPWLF